MTGTETKTNLGTAYRKVVEERDKASAENELLQGDVTFMQNEAKAWHARYDMAQGKAEQLREMLTAAFVALDHDDREKARTILHEAYDDHPH